MTCNRQKVGGRKNVHKTHVSVPSGPVKRRPSVCAEAAELLVGDAAPSSALTTSSEGPCAPSCSASVCRLGRFRRAAKEVPVPAAPWTWLPDSVGESASVEGAAELMR
jgi:hypothetical protein